MQSPFPLRDLLPEMLLEVRAHLSVYERVCLQRTCKFFQQLDPGNPLPAIWLEAYRKVKHVRSVLDQWHMCIDAGLHLRPTPSNIEFGSHRRDTCGSVRVIWVGGKEKPERRPRWVPFWGGIDTDQTAVFIRLTSWTDREMWRHVDGPLKLAIPWATEYHGPADWEYIPSDLLALTDDRVPLPFRADASKWRHITGYYQARNEWTIHLVTPGYTFFGSAWDSFALLADDDRKVQEHWPSGLVSIEYERRVSTWYD